METKEKYNVLKELIKTRRWSIDLEKGLILGQNKHAYAIGLKTPHHKSINNGEKNGMCATRRKEREMIKNG